MNSDVKIRNYPINKESPFAIKNIHVVDDNSFSVSVAPKEDESFSRNLTGIHIIDKKQAVELMASCLSDKLNITKGGINVFKYLLDLYNKLEKTTSDGVTNTTNDVRIKVNYKDCNDILGYTSIVSVWNGFAELLDKGIIARSGVTSVYFLNPTFFHPTEIMVVKEFYKIVDDVGKPIED